jgi:hypothetical protein
LPAGATIGSIRGACEDGDGCWLGEARRLDARPPIPLLVPASGTLHLSPIRRTAMTDPDGCPLADRRWRNRLVLVFAAAPDDARLRTQMRGLYEAASGLAERDTIVIEVVGSTVTVAGDRQAEPTAESLRQAYDGPVDGFAVRLVGKDGGVKLRSAETVGTSELFALIDSMPMRRREIGERRG